MKSAARLLFTGALLASLSIQLGGCDRGSLTADTALPAQHLSSVRVAEVQLSEASRSLRLPGVVRARQRAEPAFLSPGYLAERFVVRGERVTAGQRLASLQNPSLSPALAAAEAAVRELDERLVQLDADLERARELYARDLVPEERLDQALAQRNTARQAREQALARVAEAREQLADAVLRAPFDATVADLLVEPGDFVPAGQPVLVLSGDSGLEVEGKLPEGIAQRLQSGDPVTISSIASGQRTEGLVRELGLPRAGRLAPLVVALVDTADWQPGMSVHVMLDYAEDPALTVPVSAIVDPGTGQTRVYKVVQDHVALVPVTAGRLVGNRVEVTGDLAPGDRVVVTGHQQLLDGDPVRILP